MCTSRPVLAYPWHQVPAIAVVGTAVQVQVVQQKLLVLQLCWCCAAAAAAAAVLVKRKSARTGH